MLFSVPRYTLVVRGTTKEIDLIIYDEVPALGYTILLPFENVITFACVIETTPIGKGDLDLLKPVVDLKTVTDTDRKIPSARAETSFGAGHKRDSPRVGVGRPHGPVYRTVEKPKQGTRYRPDRPDGGCLCVGPDTPESDELFFDRPLRPIRSRRPSRV